MTLVITHITATQVIKDISHNDAIHNNTPGDITHNRLQFDLRLGLKHHYDCEHVRSHKSHQIILDLAFLM